jgi:poly(A) polymerase
VDVSTSREPLIVPRSEHVLSRKSIQTSALKVLYRLHRAGYAACLVGGSVRDLLLRGEPKDYDVATDARPQQIRKLFRNSRIIGRRFRLVHVYFKEGIIEVSTFRRDPDPEAQRGAPGDLLITDDNVFGTPEQDAFRRDFSVNALFYSIADFSVIDYVGGMGDLEQGVIRVIGDPDLRFREDPVRMTRACELAGRLGFTIESATQEGIQRHVDEIDKASPARLAEEMGQLLRCGHARRAMQWIVELGLVEKVLPETHSMFAAQQRGLGDFTKILPFIDGRVAAKEELPEIGLFVSLLLPEILLRCHDATDGGQQSPSRWRVREVAMEVTEPFFRRLGLSKLKKERAVETIMAFQRMTSRRWKTAEQVRMAQRSCFDDALFAYAALVEVRGESRDGLNRWRRVQKLRPAPPVPLKRRPRTARRRRRRRN